MFLGGASQGCGTALCPGVMGSSMVAFGMYSPGCGVCGSGFRPKMGRYPNAWAYLFDRASVLDVTGHQILPESQWVLHARLRLAHLKG